MKYGILIGIVCTFVVVVVLSLELAKPAFSSPRVPENFEAPKSAGAILPPPPADELR